MRRALAGCWPKAYDCRPLSVPFLLFPLHTQTNRVNVAEILIILIAIIHKFKLTVGLQLPDKVKSVGALGLVCMQQ